MRLKNDLPRKSPLRWAQARIPLDREQIHSLTHDSARET